MCAGWEPRFRQIIEENFIHRSMVVIHYKKKGRKKQKKLETQIVEKISSPVEYGLLIASIFETNARKALLIA